MLNLQFYRSFQNTEIVLFVFQLIYVQKIDRIICLVTYYGEATLNQVDRIRQG